MRRDKIRATGVFIGHVLVGIGGVLLFVVVLVGAFMTPKFG